MLHILGHSPWKCDIDTLSSMLFTNDDLLLIQDGVFAAVDNSCFLEKLIKAPANISALKEDIEARGLGERISLKIEIINYLDFVDLAVKQESQMSW